MKKGILTIVIVLLAAVAAAGFWLWNELAKKPVVTAQTWMYIQDGQVKNDSALQAWQIQQLLDAMKFEEKLQGGGLDGAYRLDSGMTAREVATKLTRHLQTPVKLTFHDIRLKEQWAARVGDRLMCDSADLMRALTDTAFLREAEMDEANVIGVLLPDTYEVYWNVKAEELVQRMLKEYHRFWTEARVAKAEALGLTPQEVTVLASIAEEETQNRSERGVVGMLYWNRLQLMMPLQADPTVKYALKDFGLKRILNSHLEVNSPYNTYRNEGLPPGPIRMVEKATIDTILNARMHTYLYMCAKPDFSGRHNFATTYGQHLRNAEAYHQALNRMKN